MKANKYATLCLTSLWFCRFDSLRASAQRGIGFGGGSISESPAVRTTGQHASGTQGSDIIDGPMRYDDGISKGILTIYAQGDEKRAELTRVRTSWFQITIKPQMDAFRARVEARTGCRARLQAHSLEKLGLILACG